MANWKILKIKENDKVFEQLVNLDNVKVIKAYYDKGQLFGSGLFMTNGECLLTDTPFSHFSAELVPDHVPEEVVTHKVVVTGDGTEFGAKMAAARAAAKEKRQGQSPNAITSGALNQG